MFLNYPYKMPPHPANALWATNNMATEVQWLELFYWMIIANDFKKVVEIGTWHGEGTWWFSQAVAKTGGHVTTVDKTKHVDIPWTNVTQVVSDSSTWLLAQPEKSIDFIFIDGDHSYKGVEADFHAARKAIRSGGCIALHDTRGVNIHTVGKFIYHVEPIVGGRWTHWPVSRGMSYVFFD